MRDLLFPLERMHAVGLFWPQLPALLHLVLLGVCFALLILVLLAHLWEGEQGAGIRYLHF